MKIFLILVKIVFDPGEDFFILVKTVFILVKIVFDHDEDCF